MVNGELVGPLVGGGCCVAQVRGTGVGETFGARVVHDKMSLRRAEESIQCFKNRRNDPGMSMKTKDTLSGTGNDQGMSLSTVDCRLRNGGESQ
jgi:hypothetical protein